ncbi:MULTISPECIES: ABC transporter substrate-binding protein [Pantoea]|uniref:ABC transporter substrate-binding protein n=1 Tax=Pantoea TaxID=53335 RepID=UPI0024774443|nr:MULTISPECIES: ABC transporter substrate-binding protein [unclassified Pantoea]GME37328.1 ABC transporter substrate-binding protein [Pantoea sp. QMID3]GME38744.1 ABC transporter substrate-binding protein [Pantoea sp. QMID1]GME52603.1 ABC transporter substrate-binding protein [Pantoea sp. QMID4]GME54638.1 ABC transporter substrate-binding protein [Pantoea sp. QMID2]
MKKPVLSLLSATLFMTLSAASMAVPVLPEPIKSRGELVAAIMPNYPPMEFKDPATNQLTGVDYDLGNAIAKKLGVTIKWQEISFEQMINAVKTKRVDLIMSGMSDTAERQKVISFIDYLTSGPQFYTLVSRNDISAQADLCGKKVGSSRRTDFPAKITEWSQKNCVAAGKPAINVVGTEGTADARAQLRQRRLDAVVQGSETLPYIMQLEKNTYKPLGTAFTQQYTGLGLPKDNPQLIAAIQGALDELIADGSYQAILKKWGLNDGAVEKAAVNQGK